MTDVSDGAFVTVGTEGMLRSEKIRPASLMLSTTLHPPSQINTVRKGLQPPFVSFHSSLYTGQSYTCTIAPSEAFQINLLHKNYFAGTKGKRIRASAPLITKRKHFYMCDKRLHNFRSNYSIKTFL